MNRDNFLYQHYKRWRLSEDELAKGDNAHACYCVYNDLDGTDTADDLLKLWESDPDKEPPKKLEFSLEVTHTEDFKGTLPQLIKQLKDRMEKGERFQHCYWGNCEREERDALWEVIHGEDSQDVPDQQEEG
jgi:hypothetical protein